MDQMIDHFIKSKKTAHGYGFFKHERSINHSAKDVVDFAMSMSKNQARKYNQYKIVPGAFISYLRYLKIIPEGLEIPNDKRTVEGFTDFLYKNGKNISLLGNLIKEEKEKSLKKMHFEMRQMFVSGEKLGRDLHKIKHKLSLEKRQGRMHGQ